MYARQIHALMEALASRVRGDQSVSVPLDSKVLAARKFIVQEGSVDTVAPVLLRTENTNVHAKADSQDPVAKFVPGDTPPNLKM